MEEKKKTYRIGELAKKADVTTRTVRYYEDLGLLKTQHRSQSGQRVYSDMDLVYLLRILQMKRYGLSLEEISKIIKLGFEDASGEKRRFELMASYDNLIKQENEIIKNHQELVRQLKWNLSQLQNAKDNFTSCPGPSCKSCEIVDSCIIRKVLDK